MPYDSGLTCLMKGHGNFNPNDLPRINKRDQPTTQQDFLKELEIVERKAVLLMRNPYHVIYSYRSYIDKGWAEHADESQFFGPGNISSQVIILLTQSNLLCSITIDIILIISNICNRLG